MEKQRKVDPDAITILQQVVHTQPNAQKPVSTSSALAVDKKAEEEKPLAARRSSTAGKVLIFLAGLGLGAAGGSIGTNYTMKDRVAGQKPSAEASVPAASGSHASVFKALHAANNNPPGVAPDAADISDPPPEEPKPDEAFEIPDTPEKLAKIIEQFKISVSAENFKSKDRFMKIMMLDNKPNEEGPGSIMNWIELPTIIQEDDILIAIRLDKPEYRNLLQFPGRMPISKVEDKNDPQIIYAYYHCINSENTQNRGASVAVLDPVAAMAAPTKKRFRTKPYLVTKGFILPKCGK